MRKISAVFKSIDWKNISTATYVRYILMILTMVNAILTHFAFNPIPVSEDTVYQVVTDVLTLLVMITNTWCNNSLTAPAIEADKYFTGLISKTEETKPEE